MSKKSKSNSSGIINFYELKSVKKFMNKSINPNYNYHKINVPFRSILIGSSGSGKTNLLMNILSVFPNTFNKLWIYTKAQEPLYDYLQSVIPEDLIHISYDNLQECENHLKNEDYYGQSLVIFDDMCNEKNQQVINELYIRGRKIGKGVSVIYLTQSYFKVPKVVRLQCQYIFIIKVSGVRDLKLILSEYNLNTTKEQLLKYYDKCCNSGVFGNFLLIDLNSTQDKTYRMNFLEYLN